MGTCYLLCKPDKGETYDLGKGFAWPTEIFEYHKVIRLPDFYPSHTVLSEYLQTFFEWDRNYSDFVAEEIWKWCGDDRIFFTNEYQDYKYYPHLVLEFCPDAKHTEGDYKETGERYYLSDPQYKTFLQAVRYEES